MRTTQNDGREKSATAGERGQRTILLGWLITMIGVVGYVVTMSRAPDNTDMIEALATEGFSGWASLSLVLAGVVVWVIGSISTLTDIRNVPDSNELGE
jgi:hypothetical protein